ncbi:glycosyltransferase, partial [candidate division KSB1 bacterium]|nr:glycosyltransferase [candidate division KSB1 bacterium]
GETGLLCEPDNIDEMISKINSLIFDDSKRVTMGKAARQYIINNHSWDAQAQRLLSICLKVLSQTTLNKGADLVLRNN